MTQLRCDQCDRLWSSSAAALGERCGVRLSGREWCRGALVEHGCGGPPEACGLPGCEECSGRRTLPPVRVSAAELAEIRRLAAGAGMSVSEWIRQRALSDVAVVV